MQVDQFWLFVVPSGQDHPDGEVCSVHGFSTWLQAKEAYLLAAAASDFGMVEIFDSVGCLVWSAEDRNGLLGGLMSAPRVSGRYLWNEVTGHVLL